MRLRFNKLGRYLLITTVITCLGFGCRHTGKASSRENATSPDSADSVPPAETQVQESEDIFERACVKTVRFEDGTTSRVTDCSDTTSIDTVKTERKKLAATLLYYGKSPQHTALGEYLKKKNLKEYKRFASIRTSFAVRTRNNDTLYLSARETIHKKIMDFPNNSPVIMDCTLNRLFYEKREPEAFLVIEDAWLK